MGVGSTIIISSSSGVMAGARGGSEDIESLADTVVD